MIRPEVLFRFAGYFCTAFALTGAKLMADDLKGRGFTNIHHVLAFEANWGGVLSSPTYTAEESFTDALGFATKYSDGSVEKAQAKRSMNSIGGFYEYKWESWGLRANYAYHNMGLKYKTGDGKNKEYVSEGGTMFSGHAVYLGPVKHFYADSSGWIWSLDLGLQLGGQTGKYSPLVAYEAWRTKVTPAGPKLAGVIIPETVSYFGLNSRILAGISIWSGAKTGLFMLAIQMYYDITMVQTSEQIWNSVSKTSFHQELYGGFALAVTF